MDSLFSGFRSVFHFGVSVASTLVSRFLKGPFFFIGNFSISVDSSILRIATFLLSLKQMLISSNPSHRSKKEIKTADIELRARWKVNQECLKVQEEKQKWTAWFLANDLSRIGIKPWFYENYEEMHTTVTQYHNAHYTGHHEKRLRLTNSIAWFKCSGQASGLIQYYPGLGTAQGTQKHSERQQGRGHAVDRSPINYDFHEKAQHTKYTPPTIATSKLLALPWQRPPWATARVGNKSCY